MTLLNRGFIIVSPKPVFINDIVKLKADAIMTPNDSEPSIYLIEEDFWDDEAVLRKYYKKIVAAEIDQLGLNNEELKSKINLDNIHEYFKISMGSLVFDLEDRSIERLKDD